MRNLRFFALVSIFLTQTLSFHTEAGLPDQADLHQPSNYVVIGAFAVHKNAARFTSYARRRHYDAQYELNPLRNLYYVYVLHTEDLEVAMNEARRLREETEFFDSWVFKGVLGREVIEQEVQPVDQTKDVNPYTTEPVDVQPRDDAEQETVSINGPPLEADNSVDGKGFVFELIRGSDQSVVEGDVDIIDLDRTRKMGTFTANKPVRISSPDSRSGKIAAVCKVFGYRKTQKEFNYLNPEGDDITVDDNNNVVVPFELARLQRGDIAVMYNVYFFKDAAAMRPESQFEVNSLLEMLQENPKYRIRIHGHTNGNAPGKIMTVTEGNYFSLTGSKEGFGSAKQLSEERADIIRQYLLDHGVEPKRMEVKAWGGKRPIHDKLSNRAHENVRVEIEILED